MDDYLEQVFKDAQERVYVSCNKYHAHTALDGCLAPKKPENKDAVTICKLVEYIRRRNQALEELVKAAKIPRRCL